jgi:hypothetical protein
MLQPTFVHAAAPPAETTTVPMTVKIGFLAILLVIFIASMYIERVSNYLVAEGHKALVWMGISKSTPAASTPSDSSVPEMPLSSAPLDTRIEGRASAPLPVPGPIASADAKQWCLVGDYHGYASCMAVGPTDVCTSQQKFTTQSDCLNASATTKFIQQPATDTPYNKKGHKSHKH